jgi:hypothetical protein
MKTLMIMAVAATLAIAATSGANAGAVGAVGAASGTASTGGTPDILLRQTRSVPMVVPSNAFASAPRYHRRHKSKHH